MSSQWAGAVAYDQECLYSTSSIVDCTIDSVTGS